MNTYQSHHEMVETKTCGSVSLSISTQKDPNYRQNKWTPVNDKLNTNQRNYETVEAKMCGIIYLSIFF